MRDRGGMVASWLALATSIALVAGPTAAPAAPEGARLGVTDVVQRTDLIGKRYRGPYAELAGAQYLDPTRSGPDRVVTVMVEFAGDTVGDRLLRQPGLRPGSTERQLSAEQHGFDRALRASGLQVTGRMLHALNGVTGRVRIGDLEALRRVAGVTGVEVAGIVHRDNSLATAASGASAAWQTLGLTGAGITIGIIDDGIDYTHADFGGSGNPADYTSNDRAVVEPSTFPTAMVVGGYDFAGDAYDAEATEIADALPIPDPDPMACGLHGTHVAGTAAGQGVVESTALGYTGNYDASSLAGVTFAVAPGAAPQAKLRAYKVFGCSGSSDDSVILKAIDKAVADKVDVINLSLGESLGTGSVKKILVKAVNRASSKGTLVVVSAGNQGAAPYLVGSPATADSALAVAAMDAGPTTWPGVDFGVLGISGVETGEGTVDAGGLTAPVKVITGCDESAYNDSSGKILVVDLAEGCTDLVFEHLDGVVAVVVITDTFFRSGLLETSVPFVLVLDTDAAPLLAADSTSITLSPGDPVPDPEHGAFAGFSSAGPRRDDQVMKPDITAPGVSIVSAQRGTGTGRAELSGTSMASPLTAGIAALVNQAHPSWTPAMIKAAIMSTADPAAISDFDPLRGGTGMIGANRAAATVAMITTTDGRHSLSFGFNALTGTFTRTKTFKITNTSASTITYTLSTVFHGSSLGASVVASPAVVAVKAKSSKTITVRFKISASRVAALPGALESAQEHLVAIDGTIVATPAVPTASVLPLRIAFSMLPKGLSSVGTGSKVSGASGSGSMRITNTGRHAGTADVFQWVLHDRAGDSPNPDVGDVIDLGVKSFPWDPNTATETGPDRQVVFAFNTAKGAATHIGQEYAVLVDVDDDLTFDYLIVGGDEGISTTGDADGHFVALTVNFETLDIIDAYSSEAPLNGSVVYLRTTASRLGTTDASMPWNILANSTSRLIDDIAFDDIPDKEWAVYHPFHPLFSGPPSTPVPIASLGSATVGFTVDFTQTYQTHQGFLIISPDDAAGTKSGTTVTVTGV